MGYDDLPLCQYTTPELTSVRQPSIGLGELLAQGKANLQAPWLGITAFIVLAVMLSVLIFIGEAVRDAFDPRKTMV